MSKPSSSPDDDLALFASFIRDDEKARRDAKKAAREERRQADEQNQLVKAKEDAAAEVKRLRSRDSATADEKAAADTAYKQALAAVVAAETGSAPAWAPEPEPEPEPGAGAESEAEAAAPAETEAEPEAEPTEAEPTEASGEADAGDPESAEAPQ